MIDGTLLMIVGALLLVLPSAERVFQGWRKPAAEAVLLGKYPTPPPSRPLARLAEEADAAIARDALSRGVRGTAATYRKAAGAADSDRVSRIKRRIEK